MGALHTTTYLLVRTNNQVIDKIKKPPILWRFKICIHTIPSPIPATTQAAYVYGFADCWVLQEDCEFIILYFSINVNG